MLPRDRKVLAKAMYVQVVPGPAGTWQIVRVDLVHPFARGFASPEEARSWLGRAVRAGLVPEGVTELEPPPEGGGEVGGGVEQQQPGL